MVTPNEKLAASLAQLQKQVPKGMQGVVRDLRKNLRDVQRQIEKAQAEREERWQRLETQVRTDTARLLKRLEKAIEPSPARKAAKKSTARRKTSRKKTTARKPARKKTARRKA